MWFYQDHLSRNSSRTSLELMYSKSPPSKGVPSTSSGREIQCGWCFWTLDHSWFCCNTGSEMGHRHGEEEHVLLPWALALIRTCDLAPTLGCLECTQPSLVDSRVGCKGRGRWVILGCLHYYPFDSGWRWKDYVTELRDSEAKLYFYHLSNYLWGLNDGLEVQNRLKFNPHPQQSIIIVVI